MRQFSDRSNEICQTTGLKAQHFADLIRLAQLISDPSGGLSGREIDVNWESFGLSRDVVKNLYELGVKYQFSSPYIEPELLWDQLIPATRTWFIENKNGLADLEECFPARDED